MTAASPEDFRAALLAAGVLAETAEEGLYGRSDAFETVALAFDSLITHTARELGATRWNFAPVQPRTSFERTGYLSSFPQLVGAVEVFLGGNPEHAALIRDLESGEDWSRHLQRSGTVLCPACCQPIYPMMGGRLSADEVLIDVTGWCFRHEPSRDPCRMQAFRQHDVVFLGRPEGVRAHLDGWLDRGTELLGLLGIEVERVVANDPFFGRSGTIMATSMRTAELKRELLAAVASDTPGTAVMSANEHKDHFSGTFGIESPDGSPAETACIGFGLERVTLALFDRHGMDTAAWPDDVRRRLRL